MTSTRPIRNVPASIHQRLLNLAHRPGIRFNLLLQRYAMERFLYRLAASSEVDRFTLKGAALFRVWTGQELRPTRDIDFLASAPEDHAALRTSFEAICAVPCPQDAVIFDPATIRMRDTREEQPYGGVRVRMEGRLGQARLHLQVDIGFGDVITPEREERDYPTLLDLPAPRLWTYPRETLVAEKFDAMVSRGTTNTRVKDLWDIACLARRFAFDGETLRTAIEETLRRRQTPLAGERPVALMPGYYLDATRAQRWHVLRGQISASADGPALLVDAGEELLRFLGPVCDSLIEGGPFMQAWSAGGLWRQSTQTEPAGDDQ
ncbi:MAG: nucleotidyl transferase AbiEii/AbiGii toxin family protein [Chloroflexi bacterium]|nr:nucleotidyl transferase AbiEii/AbiGii toxin family protein [Chloroflexota bacterium]